VRLVVRGGRALSGRVRVHGAKNAALPIIAAAILTDGVSTITSVPDIGDVRTAVDVVTSLGIGASFHGSTLTLRAGDLGSCEAPYELVQRMRASFLVAGPVLARLGRVRISLPGGCLLGSRPVDLHIKGLEALGAAVRIESGVVEATADRLVGRRIYLDYPSVGATEHLLMTACLAEGTTVIENAAEEPEIVDLATFLNSAGASVHGAGTKVIRVEGVRSLHGVRHQVIPDRIEAGTFMVATAITRGRVTVEGVVPDHLTAVIAKLREVGVTVGEHDSSVTVDARGADLRACNLKTMPYPGFPTDLQPQFTALLTLARGLSVVTETVFDNRFIFVPELRRLGAQVQAEGRTAMVMGVPALEGAPVTAPDLRAGAALVLAGLAARGTTEIEGVRHIDRGYQDLDTRLRQLGAEVCRVGEEEGVPGERPTDLGEAAVTLDQVNPPPVHGPAS